MDYLYREVDPELWIIPAPAGLALGLVSVARNFPGPLWLPYLFNAFIILVFYLLHRLDLLGGADLAAVIFVSLSLPVLKDSIMPTVVLVTLYSAPFILGYYLLELGVRCGLTCVKRFRVKAKGSELVSRYRWWYPSSWRIEGDPHEVIARMNAWDRMVEASPLLPLVTALSLGLITSIILGDTPIIALLGGMK